MWVSRTRGQERHRVVFSAWVCGRLRLRGAWVGNCYWSALARSRWASSGLRKCALARPRLTSRAVASGDASFATCVGRCGLRSDLPNVGSGDAAGGLLRASWWSRPGYVFGGRLLEGSVPYTGGGDVTEFEVTEHTLRRAGSQFHVRRVLKLWQIPETDWWSGNTVEKYSVRLERSTPGYAEGALTTHSSEKSRRTLQELTPLCARGGGLESGDYQIQGADGCWYAAVVPNRGGTVGLGGGSARGQVVAHIGGDLAMQGSGGARHQW